MKGDNASAYINFLDGMLIKFICGYFRLVIEYTCFRLTAQFFYSLKHQLCLCVALVEGIKWQFCLFNLTLLVTVINTVLLKVSLDSGFVFVVVAVVVCFVLWGTATESSSGRSGITKLPSTSMVQEGKKIFSSSLQIGC